MGGDCGDGARAYLATQARALRGHVPAAAAGDADAIHVARTATRRAGAALTLCRPFLPPREARAAREDLRTLGRELGAARDPAVALQWLRDATLGGPDTFVVPERVVAELESARDAALATVRRSLAGSTAADLPALLDRLADCHLTCRSRDADRAVRRRARREWRRLDRALRGAAHVDDGDGARDEALHAARRQARRARYAAEALGGEAAHRSAARAEAVQEALGAQHDAVLVRAALDRAAAHARASGEDARPYDLLRDLARHAAREAERDAVPAARRAVRRGHRRWLD